MIVWFEVDDLFVHFDWNLHPTGIQRVALAIMQAARAAQPGGVAFCRLRRDGAIAALDFAAVAEACADAPAGGSMPRWLRQVARFAARRPARRLGDRFGNGTRAFAARIAPDDVMVCLGLPWKHPDYGARIAAAKRRYGFRFAAMIYDVLPLTDPEYFSPSFIAAFAQWFERLLPACDLIFAGANHGRDAVRAVCAARGLTPPPIERLVFGAGFAGSTAPAAASSGRSLPRSFVLYVSTIGRRKNHGLLLRLWRRLAERHGDAALPALVFLGTGGDLGAVRAQIDASQLLRAKVTLVADATDAALADAYRRCLFTVYPSFTEGWGLPVAESLAAGKFCVASNRASLPEVGGDLVDYFNPADDDDALAQIERAIFDADYLARRTARIVAEYRAPSWDDCAASLLRALQPVAAPLGTAA